MNFSHSQGPHDSSQRPQNRHRTLEPPHYTVFGFSQIEGNSNAPRYIEEWFMHAYVNKHEFVTGVRVEKSTTNRRHLIAGDMTFLSVSCY